MASTKLRTSLDIIADNYSIGYRHDMRIAILYILFCESLSTLKRRRLYSVAMATGWPGFSIPVRRI